MFDVGRMDDFVDGSSSKEQSGETTLMELLATKPLNPFSYKPWPQQYIKALRQQGILRQPCFYPGDELIINFADRRQAHLITVMYTTNNAQRSKKLHAYYEEFGLKGWTTGYVKIGGGEFISLPEETKHPVYVQATHAIQVPKMRASSSVKSKKDSDKSGSKKSIGAASAAVPSKQEVQTQILDGRVELARIVFNLVSWEEDIQKSLEKLSF
ncbi:hypothetical protein BDP27DRAFT_1333462 [Rhodocollybia butyracea]|uniref:Uncharacterized protein n=1 Tax=Rhodocollybia butyracea TaxID=206335 RepID=A0A9P5PL09_9AGAR|nr:hypothetical protein BDP27DRAFT_1333462 [Rhodocollybia butyracea]